MGNVEKLATMPIPLYKSDWCVCGSCFCTNNYLLMPTTCCASERVCLCCGDDCAGLPVPEQTPKTIACLGLACYPQVGCCKSIRDLYAGDEAVLNGIDDVKEKFMLCSGCCLGPVCAGNGYLLMPFTCCYAEAQCICLGSDCSFPCSDKVPMALTCFLPGLMVYPEVGCCKKVSDVFADQMESGV